MPLFYDQLQVEQELQHLQEEFALQQENPLDCEREQHEISSTSLAVNPGPTAVTTPTASIPENLTSEITMMQPKGLKTKQPSANKKPS